MENILSHHLHGNRSERGSSRTTVGSSTAISTKYGGDPKTISKLIILTKYGGEPDTTQKSNRKTILKIILTQNIRQYERNSAFCWSKFAGNHNYLVWIYMDQVLFEKLQLYYVYCTTAVSLDNTNCCPSLVVSEESKTYKNVWQNIQHQKSGLEA